MRRGATLETYVRGQREHHRVKRFEEAYRAFLLKHEIAFDEKYMFDGESRGELRRRYATKSVFLPSIRGLKTHGYRRLVAPRPTNGSTTTWSISGLTAPNP